MPSSTINPHFDLSYALEGRIVTMDSNNTILPKGRIFIRDGNIIDVRAINGGFPDGFTRTDVIKSGGTIYPGLIELHNHLPYNILPLWISEQRYPNRGKWAGLPGYKVNIQGPMQTLGKSPGFPQAIVKYVESKCLIGGVTTSQGVTLFRSNLRKSFFKGAIRNVEETNEASLPEVNTRIADIEKDGASAFKSRLSDIKTTLLHLAEGADEKARSFFLRLKISNNNWAISNKLNGIHCNGLLAEDFEILSQFGASMTWSPFSNLLLYGQTADIEAAKQNNIRISLGSDWSPSGSKNLLEELKVAKLVSDNHLNGPIFTNEELVQMVTINPANILGWGASLGSIENGKKADLIIINGYKGNAYEKLIKATEKNLYGVFINGVPRYTNKRLMAKFNFQNNELEEVNFDTSNRVIFNKESDPENLLQGLSLQDATDLLTSGLSDLPNRSLTLENASANGFLSATENPFNQDWILLPDFHEKEHGILPENFEGGETVKYSTVAVPLPLDTLTVIDGDEHFNRLADQPNIPDYIREELPKYYNRPSLESRQSSFEIETTTPRYLQFSVTLKTFRKRSSNLTRLNKLTILHQAKILLNQVYVHKILKKSMYAVNPLERIELMIKAIQFRLNDEYEDDNYFHHQLIDIFSSLRDLHTRYLLPNPYKNRFAFLPFLLEEYFATEKDIVPHYIVTKLFKSIIAHKKFKKGVEIILWNNMPIDTAIKINSRNQFGSNKDAQHAKGIDTMTIRPIGTSIPPPENAVRLTCLDKGGNIFEVEYEWLVAYNPPHLNIENDNDIGSNIAYGYDFDTLAINNVKVAFYVQENVKSGSKMNGINKVSHKSKKRSPSKWIYPKGNHAIRAKWIKKSKGSCIAYIRIFNFISSNEHAFVEDFIDVLNVLKQKKLEGLIIDIRGNGGGLIPACELLLAKLKGSHFFPQKFQFLSSGLTLDLVRKHTDRSRIINLRPWSSSLLNSKRTGEVYSVGQPISSITKAEKSRRIFSKQMVLITDAMCYSAGDMFAAGFQDLKIGKILGIHANTGAGGANVWSHNILKILWDHNNDSENIFEHLPQGTNMTVAVRRTLRSNGDPLEDLGVRPNTRHKITKNDLLNGNEDLIRSAINCFE